MAPDLTPAVLRSPADRVGFFTQVQALLDRHIPWDAVHWQVAHAWQALDPLPLPPLLSQLPQPFVDTAKAALLHSDDDRFMRLHKAVIRLLDDPSGWCDVLHPEHVHLKSLEKQVRRELHKMKAFVRFNQVGAADAGHGEPPQYVAWFEPRFHIVEAAAPFFMRRFAGMRWSILTPKGCARWDGTQLSYGPPASKADAPPPDAGEALWLTYYARIFNPARVKVNAMKKEMPVYYWNNLPEARLIAPLLADAPRRSAEMLQHLAAVDPRHPPP